MSTSFVSRSFTQGDIISWDREPWSLRSPWNRSVSEMLDVERDICNMRARDTGYFMVPQPLSFAESVHVCKKLSGTPISYVNETDFNDLVYFLSLASNMRASGCAQTLGDGSTSMKVWGGGSDEAREGAWVTYDSHQAIEVTHATCNSTVSVKIIKFLALTLD